jgi:hypothetical protein
MAVARPNSALETCEDPRRHSSCFTRGRVVVRPGLDAAFRAPLRVGRHRPDVVAVCVRPRIRSAVGRDVARRSARTCAARAAYEPAVPARRLCAVGARDRVRCPERRSPSTPRARPEFGPNGVVVCERRSKPNLLRVGGSVERSVGDEERRRERPSSARSCPCSSLESSDDAIARRSLPVRGPAGDGLRSPRARAVAPSRVPRGLRGQPRRTPEPLTDRCAPPLTRYVRCVCAGAEWARGSPLRGAWRTLLGSRDVGAPRAPGRSWSCRRWADVREFVKGHRLGSFVEFSRCGRRVRPPCGSGFIGPLPR